MAPPSGERARTGGGAIASAAAAAQELFSLLLVMRAELAAMRETVGAQLRRLEQRVARMERSHAFAAGARVAHAAPCADKGGDGVMRRVERAPARSLRLDDLSADVLASIAAQLPEDDELAAALTCRKLRGVVERRQLAAGHTGARTRVASALGSSARLEWSVACGLPLTHWLSRQPSKRLVALQAVVSWRHLPQRSAHGATQPWYSAIAKPSATVTQHSIRPHPR
ncbi:hypothetical protein KFE25_007263 [Diacronema lutheri]|uniref:F-box domain-containing protein n=1 Tax=Diacronema lutheri TaxID=2081491 RepID=A0A8J6C419_DIALT|nr:hypothetical protein KFE25_007263 [Diacronema lutheri]